MKKFNVAVTITKEDIIALAMYNLRQKRRNFIIINAAILILLVYFFDHQFNNIYLVWFISICLVTSFIFLSIQIVKIRAIRQYNSQKAFRQPLYYELFDDHYEVKSIGLESSITWASRFAIRQNESYIFIYHFKEVASIIPKRYFDIKMQHFFDELIRK